MVSAGERTWAMLGPRLGWRPEHDTAIAQVCKRTVSGAGWEPLVTVAGNEGWVRGNGLELEVDVADTSTAAEACLRLAWHLAVAHLGGFLVHSSCVAAGDRALVAAGSSGDGKSTLASLARAAGLTILSDEVNALFPDGDVRSTPFLSDVALAGHDARAAVRYWVGLRKGDTERWEPMSAAQAMQLLGAQTFDTGGLGLPRPELRRRQLAFLGHVTPRWLTFRKHPDAGAFVRDALLG